MMAMDAMTGKILILMMMGGTTMMIIVIIRCLDSTHFYVPKIGTVTGATMTVTKTQIKTPLSTTLTMIAPLQGAASDGVLLVGLTMTGMVVMI